MVFKIPYKRINAKFDIKGAITLTLVSISSWILSNIVITSRSWSILSISMYIFQVYNVNLIYSSFQERYYVLFKARHPCFWLQWKIIVKTKGWCRSNLVALHKAVFEKIFKWMLTDKQLHNRCLVTTISINYIFDNLTTTKRVDIQQFLCRQLFVMFVEASWWRTCSTA